MKKYILYFIFLFIISLFVMAEQNNTDQGFALEFGRFRIANTPKFLEDGLQNDFLFGFFYTDKMKLAGDLRLRYINGSENDINLWDIEDSMLNRNRKIVELFLLGEAYTV